MLLLQLQLIDDEQDQAAGDQRAADDEGVEQHGLDEAVQQRADHGRRQEGDEHADDETPRRGVAEDAQGDIEQAAEIDQRDRQDRAELDQHLEGLAIGFEAEEMAEQEQMPGRGDG